MGTGAEDKVNTLEELGGRIYAYSTPGVLYHDGWLKIGFTTKQNVDERIEEQTRTVDIRWTRAWDCPAVYEDELGIQKRFNDQEFHRYLTDKKGITQIPNREWFRISVDDSKEYFDEFVSRKRSDSDEKQDYELRKEQADAVAVTEEYFNKLGKEDYGTEKAKFLWNAKPRFGKTLTTYHLVRQMKLKKVLIVTNRPSISDAWVKDFFKYIAWRVEEGPWRGEEGQWREEEKRKWCFVSENGAAEEYSEERVKSIDNYTSALKHDENKNLGMIAFESLPGLKGSTYFGGKFPKLEWMAKEYRDGSGKLQHGIEFDLLVIDESHEGVDTMLTERAFRNISRKYTLYLSGTPFKALADEQFSEKQIFNWSYVDEQKAKEEWGTKRTPGDEEKYNPYKTMPTFNMFTYQLSSMIRGNPQIPVADEAVDYAFDLNEFFRTENKKFVHKEKIKKFLEALTTNEKYPFSTPELCKELSHTFWLLDRVQSAKALAKLLREEEAFKDYEIVLAVGDGKPDEEKDETEEEALTRVKKQKSALRRVRDAIKSGKKTITLSVGQLTVGVTVPEWSGVLMLCNMKSPASYIQAIFRAQNEYVLMEQNPDDPKKIRPMYKKNAYVFDFDPARSLAIYNEFARSLCGGKVGDNEGEENNKQMLNYFPVFGEDSNGELIKLDMAQVLSIPRKLISQEVVRRGFMSNSLFQDVSNLFGAPSAVREILEKLTPANEKKNKGTSPSIPVNKGGKGPRKKVNEVKKALEPHFDNVAKGEYDALSKLKAEVVKAIIEQVVTPVVKEYDLSKGIQEDMEQQIRHEIDDQFEGIIKDYELSVAKKSAWKALSKEAVKIIEEMIKKKGSEFEERGRRIAEEKHVHVCLRGLLRAIPSLIMAYDEGDLTLKNFDDRVDADVFEEVTGITVDNFRFLRDGGDYTNPDTGGTEHFNGNLFDEVLFNTSVEEFRKKKQELANYLEEDAYEDAYENTEEDAYEYLKKGHKEAPEKDLFSYIPPLKTNQIFTPKWVVKEMVKRLEKKNPGCFDNPENTFADLYMKSGQYIAEIVRRLFHSEKMKEHYPDNTERLKHILTKQVYGMAPTRIIYLIATNYIFGPYEKRKPGTKLKSETKNFVQADAAKAAQNGTLAKLVEEKFGTSE